MKLRVALVVIAAVFLFASSTQAAVVTVDVTIRTVNPQARGITVVYKTELGEKTIELDVSRKAEITLNGKEGTLDSLGPGLKGKVSFDRDLAIVTKIEATGVIVKQKRPELVVVSELNGEDWNNLGCLSEDGLTIYWQQSYTGKKSMLWTAHRENPQAFFKDKKELFQGAFPTVSSDALEMILQSDRSDGQKGGSLYVTTREALDKPWERPREIPELAKFFAIQPCLSSDGLTLYFLTRGDGEKNWDAASVVQATRKDRSSTWSSPKPVHNVTVDYGALRTPFVTPDGLNLLCSITRLKDTGEKGNLVIWSRPATGRPFSRGRYVEPENLPQLVGYVFRYVAATNELFFSRYIFENKKMVQGRINIWVVKNFTLPK